MKRLQGWRGFTLIELLISLAILGILMTIALPSYRVFQTRTVATEGALSLLTIASVQERARFVRGRYLDYQQLLPMIHLPRRVEQHFQLVVNVADGAGHYVLHLVPKPSRLGLEEITLDSLGRRHPERLWR